MSKQTFLLATFLSLFAVKAQALVDWEFKPYLGVDASARDTDLEAGFGEHHFRAHYPDVNFFLGTVFYKYLGLEGGYEHALRQDNKRYYEALQPVLGFTRTDNVNGLDSLHLAESFLQGWHLNLMGYWPICPKLRTELFGHVGLAWLKMHFNTTPIYGTDTTVNPIVDWQSDTRSVFRWGIGLKQMVTDNFGLRAFFRWENTSKLEKSLVVPVALGRENVPPTTQGDYYTARPKDSTLLGVGFFFQIG